MRLRFSFVFAIALLSCVGLRAADDPFVGTWKMNADKSQLTGMREEIKDLGGNKYEFIFGDDKETIVADGADHPTKYGGTWAIKQEAPDKWTEVRKMKGKVTSTATWTYTDGGNTVTIETKGTRPDGTSYTESFTAKRTSGSGSGPAGIWESTTAQPAVTDWEIKAYGTDGLSFVTPAYDEHLDMKFDGKDYTDRGPRVAPGSTSSGKRIDDHTIEITDKLKGKEIDKEEIKVSEDGKTLTMTVHYPGEDKQQVIVFDRQ